MGYALAAAAQRKKCNVVVITGPAETLPPKGVTVVPVITAAEMFSEVKKYLSVADVFISVAAVADYRPAHTAPHKMKKDASCLTLRLVPTVDILAYAGKKKGKKVLVGFALESKNLLRSAKEKLRRKNIDLIVANANSAIGQDAAHCWLIDRDSVKPIGVRDKKTIAERIINEALRICKDRKTA
jgi:phosphopantothenoylcysteine decarboxylase/phosphopantothenate--cysteine ligase